ncbi:hypothetical protein [Pseudopelagicola sp. nBUS_19]|uniref:hypothetical protein n=1 Tax=Pseudopelagicola sp. nBUS_19 TaxID=3395316 RepID=UPI003EBD392C
MSEKKISGKTEVKKNTEKSETPKTSTEKTTQENSTSSGGAEKKSDAPKSASQTSLSHFSSVSTPEYRSGWNKIFGKSDADQPTAEPLTKYELRKAMVSEQWRQYQETKDPKHLAKICRELPFFEHPEVGEEIANLLVCK